MPVVPTAALKPFLAPLLLRRETGPRDGALLTAVVREVEAEILSTPMITRSAPDRSPTTRSGGLRLVRVEYSEESRPSWTSGPLRTDLSHHLVVVAVKGSYVAICASDSGLRAKLGLRLTAATPVGRSEIENAFVGDRAATLWLAGVHTPTDVKPSSKVLMGSALENALDPLGDQTYGYTAVRSSVPVPGRNGAARSMVGAAPMSGRIWIDRAESWADFTTRIEVVIDRLAGAPPARPRFDALARPIADLTPVSDAYALSLLSPLLFADGQATPQQLAMATKWADEAEFVVRPGAGAAFDADVSVAGVDLGTLSLAPVMRNETVELTSTWSRVGPGAQADRDECDLHIADRQWPKVHYESGHAIALGRCFESGHQSRRFDWSFQDLTGWTVTQEKPTALAVGGLAAAVAAGGGTSLFGYVIARYAAAGHLACDDGSMEMADFVHIADNDLVTLIHIKGSKTAAAGRQVSVANYEVVVGQAVKNLRNLERRTLEEMLRGGAHHAMAAVNWHNGILVPNRNAVIARAARLPADYPRRVVVLQPQLTEREEAASRAAGAARGRQIRMKQLDTLMLAARLSCAAVGAEFRGWAAR